MLKPDIRFVVPLYDQEVCFFIGSKRFTDFSVFCKKTYGTAFPEITSKVETVYGLCVGCMVYLADGYSYNDVAHEIYHVACAIEKNFGLECEESVAYVVGWITGKFYEKRDKIKKA